MTHPEQHMHLHIQNSDALGEVFEITPARLEAALTRHPGIDANVNITLANDEKSFEKEMQTADALFAWDFDRARLASMAPNLRWIQLQGAGINHLLPLDWIPDGVAITNSRGAHGSSASEYLIMSILALNNRLPEMVHNQSNHKWNQLHASAIGGKTLLIYGVGHIGGDTATAAKYFGMNVLGIRRTGAPHRAVDQMYQPQDLHALLPQADFVLVTAPHTPKTERVFGSAEFELMKQGAGFINYSRAQLVDYDALESTLRKNQISAIVDVFNQEPLPQDSSLWNTPNLIITPHSASNDPVHHARRSLDILLENVGRYKNNEPLINIIDPVQQY